MTNYSLGPFQFDTQNQLLYRDGEPVALGRRAIAVLQSLIERPGAVVAKDALIKAVWGNQAVEENNLTVQIAALRRALSMAPGGRGWVETISRRGYRFVGPVVPDADGGTARWARGGGVGSTEQTELSPAEHRPIIVLSCAVVGAADGGARMRLEELRRAVAAFHSSVSEIAARYRGHVSRHLGNEVLVLFGYPTTRERDAEQAVRAGLAICAAAKDIGSSGAELVVCRVGIATGAVIVGGMIGKGDQREHEIIGAAPDVATRLRMFAQPETVAIDAQTRDLIGDLFECHEIRSIGAAHGSEEVTSWQVLGALDVDSRFEALRGATLSPLVGRDEEVALLLRRWDRAEAGEGQVVLISGEPGIGKSRIAAALEDGLRNRSHVTVRYFCSPYHQDSALHPFVDQLVRAAQFADSDTPEEGVRKLRAVLLDGASRDEELVLVADLLSLPAAGQAALSGPHDRARRQRTLEILIRHIEAFVRRQPTVLLVEDIHWIDPTSQELLDLALPRLRELPVLVLITFRPDIQPSWVGQPQVTSLVLNRLTTAERVALAQLVAGGKALPQEVLEQINERADGVPLFVEELTRSVLETGVLREGAHRYVLDGPLPFLAIPTSLSTSLMARLDSVHALRRMAQVCAALGREFSFRLVLAVVQEAEDEVRAGLSQLVVLGLLVQRGTLPEAVYSFKHALLQDATHDTLLRENRQQLHAEIASAMEAGWPELLESQPELFAQHYAEAGLVERAVEHWGKAGRRSVARSALAEAVTQFSKALEQLSLLPQTPDRQRQELEFRIALGAASQTSKGFSAPETGRAFARARELWEELGCPVEYLRAPMGVSGYHNSRGELAQAQSLNSHFLHLAQQRNEPSLLCMAHVISGRTLLHTGSFVQARSHLEQAGALYDRIPSKWARQQSGLVPRVGTDGYLATTLLCLGHVDRAKAKISNGIAYAESIRHTPSITLAHVFGAIVNALLGDEVALEREAQRAGFLAQEHDFALYAAQSKVFRGWLDVRSGRISEGLQISRNGLDAYRSIGSLVWVPHLLDVLASAYEMAGQCEEALTQLDRALEIVDQTGERWYVAELMRHKGQLLARQGRVEAAEGLLLEALRVSQAQGARLWELRAAMALARVCKGPGKSEHAYSLLKSAYGSFGEDRAAPDLRAAGELLDELRERSDVA